MDENAYGVLEAIVNNTDSSLILFFVIIAVIAVPFYVASSRRRKQDKAHEIQRDERLLKVITDNTSVMSGLKVTLDSSKIDTKTTLDRIHTRIDEQVATIQSIAVDLARIDTKMDKSLANETEIASKLNKTLLIISKNEGNE